MDIFFNFLKKSLVATMFIIFGFVGTYVPQTWNQVETVHAGGAGGGYTIPQGVLAHVSQLATNVATTATWALNTIISFATNSLFVKEYILDGIAWAIGKAFISSMVNSLISWINSGFQGSPAFVQDLEGFLRNAADLAVTEYVQDLGAIGSFVCAPFRLDVQVAVATVYTQQTRIDQPAPTCTLQGVINNITSFTSGVQGSFAQGGWDDFLDITSNPTMYTPYGAVLAAETGAQMRIINTKNEEVNLLKFGSGFLSGKICQAVTGPGGQARQDCFISKPGKIIEEALSFNLDSGRQSLVAADEIDEIIASLLGQLANQAITGAAGLLGLSGGTGQTSPNYSGGSYLNNMVASSTAITTSSLSGTIAQMNAALAIQSQYNAAASTNQPLLTAFANNTNNPVQARTAAAAAAAQAGTIITNTNSYITQLNTMIANYNAPGATPGQQTQIANTFAQMSLYTQTNLVSSQQQWNSILNNSQVTVLANAYANTISAIQADIVIQQNYNNLANQYLNTITPTTLTALANDPNADPTKRAQAAAAVPVANAIITNTNTYISQLNAMLTILQDPNSTQAQKDTEVINYQAMNNLYTQGDITASQTAWNAILAPVSYATSIAQVSAALTTQQNYNALANLYIPQLNTFIASATASSTFTTAAKLTNAQTQLANANTVLSTSQGFINTLAPMLATLQSPTASNAQKTALVNQFNLMTTLYSNAQVSGSQTTWAAAIIP